MGKITAISDASHSDHHDGSADICDNESKEASALQVPTAIPVQVRSDLPPASDQVLVNAEDLAAFHVAMENLRTAITRVKSKKSIRRATIAVQRAISYLNEDDHVLSSTPAPFLANEGGDSLKRQEAAVFGGVRSGKRQKTKISSNAPPAAPANANAPPADAPPAKFVGVKKSGKQAVGRSVWDKLHASSDHNKSSVLSGVVKGVRSPKGFNGAVESKSVRRSMGRNKGARRPIGQGKGVHEDREVMRVGSVVPEAPAVPRRAPMQGALIHEPNSNVGNCALCGAVRGGTYGHTCSICNSPICSFGFALQNNCPIIENPDGPGIGCAKHWM